MSSSISVIIPHWNTPNELKNLLTHLHNENSESAIRDIIVVDNNSNDELSWLKKEFPHIQLIHNKANQGYAFACNQGVLKAKGDWLCFCNPDVEIDAQKIQQIVHFASTRHIHAMSPEPSSDRYKRPLPSLLSFVTEFTPLSYLVPTIFSKKLTTHFTLFGGLLCIKKDTLLKIGGWDERFFLWFEDSDLTKKLIDDGFNIGWAPVNINHAGGTSFSLLNEQTKRDIFFLSMKIYAQKHFKSRQKKYTELLSKRYTKAKLPPQSQKGLTLVVPNAQKSLLDSFLENNYTHMLSADNPVIVTSALKNVELFDYRHKFPGIRFIVVAKNKGFAATVNIGFRTATTEWVATVNDDTILNADWIRKALENVPGDAGSINPIIYKNDGAIESAGIRILAKGKAEPIVASLIAFNRSVSLSAENSEIFEGEQKNTMKLSEPSYLFEDTDFEEKMKAEIKGKSHHYKVPVTNAAAVIYKHEALEKAGLFDEDFGSYLEDIDLALQIGKRGYSNYVSMQSSVIHYGQSTSSKTPLRKRLYDARNWWYVIYKNWGIGNIVRYTPQILLERLRNVYGIFKRN